MNIDTEVVIHTENLGKAYGNIQALKSLSIDIPKNSIVGFLGPNGAGKSTLIKLLLGLIRPTQGGGEIFGMDIKNYNTRIRKRIGYLSQNPRFYPSMTVREVLRFTAGFFFKGPETAIQTRINEMLRLTGLENKAERLSRELSGGERQRLGIAQAQINYPDLLILDEPAAALDPMGRHDVLEIMDNIRSKTTIFYSTHILEDVQRVSDRVVILNQGDLVAQGPIDQLLSDEGGLVYTLKLAGIHENTRSHLLTVPWITEIRTESENGYENWSVSVTDQSEADQRLLRMIMADEGLRVLEFGKQKHNLEDVFINLVGKEVSHVG